MGGRIPVLALLLSLAALPCRCEITRLAPLALPPRFSEAPGAFSGVAGYVAFVQYVESLAPEDYGKDHDIAVLLTLWSSPAVSVQGLARSLFQNRQHPEGPWLFWPRSLVTDLRLLVSWRRGRDLLTASYRHDCKHDIEGHERDAVHDALALDYVLSAGPSAVGIELEANLPVHFQEIDPEPDLGRVTIHARWTSEGPQRRSPGGPFAAIRLSAIARRRDTRVRGVESPGWDAHLQLGWVVSGRLGGLALYAQAERISDNWATLEPEPAWVFSWGAGIGIAAGGAP